MFPDITYYATQTLAYGKNRLALEWGGDYLVDNSLTLNHLPGSQEQTVADGMSAALTVPHPIRYYGLGSGGNFMDTVSNIRRPYIPKNIELNLYAQLPFRIVPELTDLTTMERSIYRGCRKIISPRTGTEVYAFYLKKLYGYSVTIDTRLVDGNGNSSSYSIPSSQLTPIPDPNSRDHYASYDHYVANTVSISGITMTQEEIANVMYYLFAETTSTLTVNEIGLYTGVDGSGPNINNAYAVQLAYKYCDNSKDNVTAGQIFAKKLILGSSIRLIQ